MSSPSLTRVVRGSLWLYLRSLVNNLSGFVYWMVISAVGGAEIVGLTSATVALAGVVTSTLSLGESVGVRRFMGVYIGRGDREGVAKYFWTIAVFRVITFIPVGLVMMGLSLLGLSFGSLGGDMLFYGGIIVLLGSITVFDDLLASHLETKPIFIGSVVGNVVKLFLGIGLVSMGWGWVGAVVGYIALTPVAFTVKLLPSLKLAGFRLSFDFQALRDVLKAGVVQWLPGMMAVLGQQLGVLTLFGVRGALETGLYYVSFAIMGVVTGLGGSVLGLMMPVLSGMEDGRKRACWRAIKVSLALVTPLAFVLAAYPEVPLGLLGKEYVNAASMLMLLALAIPAALISAGVTSLVYAYGMYMTVLILGLVGNLSRIVTYVPLSYLMGGVGVALSYALGAYIALAAAVLVCRRIGFNPGFREALLTTVFPLSLAFIFHLLKVCWLVGVPLLLLLSYIGYLKMGVLGRGDLRELAYALAPRKTVNEIYQHLRPIIDWLID